MTFLVLLSGFFSIVVHGGAYGALNYPLATIGLILFLIAVHNLRLAHRRPSQGDK